MIGGAPIFAPQMPQGYAPYPVPQDAPAPAYTPPPRYAAPQAYAPRPQPVAQFTPPSRPQAAPASQPAPRQPSLTPRPRIRAQSADEAPAPSRIELPSPEALGLAVIATSSATADLAALQRRLDQLGAQCFHLDRLPSGSLRLVCLFPTGEAGKMHRIEAEAGSAVQAAGLVLQHAETWRRQAH